MTLVFEVFVTVAENWSVPLTRTVCGVDGVRATTGGVTATVADADIVGFHAEIVVTVTV